MRSRPTQNSASWLQIFITIITLAWVKTIFDRMFGRAEQRTPPMIRRLRKIAQDNRQREKLEEQQKQVQVEQEKARKSARQAKRVRKLSSRKRAESAPPVPVKREDKPNSRRASVRGDEQRPRSQTLVKKKSGLKTPLLTFSAVPDYVQKMKCKPPVESATVVKPTPQPVVNDDTPTDPETQFMLNRMTHNLAIVTDIIPDQVRKIQRAQLPEDHRLIGLARGLAIVYQVHRLNLLCKYVQEDNANKEIQYHLRTELVHRLNPAVLGVNLLRDTIDAVGNLDFTELDGVVTKLKVDADHLTWQLQKLPLFAYFCDEEQVPAMSVDDVKVWMVFAALPVFNEISQLAVYAASYEDRVTYYDAQRMLAILIGEQCVGIPEYDQQALPVTMRAFRELRNELAHHALPKDESKKIAHVVALAKHFNLKVVGEHDNVFAMLFREEANQQHRLMQQTLRRGSSHI